MTSSSAVGVYLAEKYRAHRDGYDCRLSGGAMDAFDASKYLGPFAAEGWRDGWLAADAGKPNLHAPAPASSGPSGWRVAGYLCLIAFLIAVGAYFQSS